MTGYIGTTAQMVTTGCADKGTVEVLFLTGSW